MAFAYAHRFVDYSAVLGAAPDRAVLRFVYGVRGNRRQSPVSLKQIQEYFRATPDAFIVTLVDELLDRGLLVVQRTSPNRKRTGYVYEITNDGVGYLYNNRWDRPDGRDAAPRELNASN